MTSLPFLRRLIDAQCGGSKPHHRLRITQGICEDLNLWWQFLQNQNGTSAFIDSEWINSSDTHLFTDTSGNHGFGAFVMGRWANGRWPNEWVQNGWTKDITMLELFPIVLAVRLWGRHLQNKRVLFVCDNQAVVAIINKQTAKPPQVMSLLRRLILLCLQHNILFKASYIPTHANVIADALSRFQWSRFKEAAPRADEIPAHIPQDIWQI
ncbi:uncharacterized protein [Haliotis cracherodii]|uniref:uncharacterized protein n=1 Tax=Haliotis cracherodii TaxID=6455 RepID=UPI0039E9294F